MNLPIARAIPDALRTVPARDLIEVVPAPTLFHLPGRRNPPVFVSVVLHGNEDVGLRAVQQVLAKYRGRELPRALSLFVGNVTAARAGVRRLPGQPDYNRVWPGTEHPHSPERELMAAVTAEMRRVGVFASLDVHNNTGFNPHYACACELAHRHLHLAGLFGPTVVYFTRPKGVQAGAFARFCPAVTLECGKVGDEAGVTHAAEMIDACLHAAEIPDHPVNPGDVRLFHTVATIRVPPDVSFTFGNEPADLKLPPELDHWNFAELEPGTLFGRVRPGTGGRLEVTDQNGRDCTAELFDPRNGEWRLRQGFMPAMLTLNAEVIRQDCLGYLMERYPLPAG